MRFIGTLHPTPPYHFARSIRAAHYHSVLDHERDGEYWRAVRLNGETALLRVTSSDPHRLDVHLAATSGPVPDSDLLATAAHLLGVQADLSAFYRAIERDPVLWPVVEPLHGVRHVRAASIFEALVTTIIEQQITLRQAQQGERWLVAWGGSRIDYAGETFYTFPTAEQLAAASITDLTPLKITFRRMQVIIDIASLYAHQLAPLHSQPAGTVYAALLSLKGIGQWTAAWAVIRALGHYQYIGESDVALQAAINHYFYQQPGRAAPQRVAETLGRYGDFAGAAAFFVLLRWAHDRY